MKSGRYSPREEKLRKILRDRRCEVGLRQEDLADKLGAHQSFVSKYESGERSLSFAETIDICDALGIDPISLLKEYLGQHET